MSNQKEVAGRPGKASEAAEDARLIAQVIDGRSEAFDSLVRRYERRALAVAYRLLGNVEDAADVTQDAMIRAYRNLRQLSDHRRFGPWLMRIVGNLSLNYRRSRQASASASVDELLDTSDSLRSAGGTRLIDDGRRGGETEAAELQAVVDAAIQALPEKQRMSLVLFSIEGMSQQDVAQMLDCTVELVKWNVFQARKQLRRALAKSFPAHQE